MASRQTLREWLRIETRALHDRLDESLAPAALSEGDDYARFLDTQYRARLPIERWIGTNADAPPPQTPHIAADLVALGRTVPDLDPVADAELRQTLQRESAGALGAYWVLAGSSLGNRAMLSRRRKLGREGPVAFLSDPAMPAYFKSLRPRLERVCGHAEAQPAIQAAKLTFERFILSQDTLEIRA